MMYSVQDGTRLLKFEGTELAHSSSEQQGKPRWVEFTLYRTKSGKYVVSRVGVSMTYHRDSCPVVKRNNIQPIPAEVVTSNLSACHECKPSLIIDEQVFPETPRHRGQVFNEATGVVSWLKQYDSRRTEYLTDVARRLLEDAATVDSDISDAFYVEYV